MDTENLLHGNIHHIRLEMFIPLEYLRWRMHTTLSYFRFRPVIRKLDSRYTSAGKMT